MAIKPLNSIDGFSVGETAANIILANGDITTVNFTANGISNLGPVGNVIITGGSNNYILTTDGAGNLTWEAPAGGGGIGGSNTQVQYNNNGAFAGSANFVFNNSSNTLTTDNIYVTNDINIAGNANVLVGDINGSNANLYGNVNVTNLYVSTNVSFDNATEVRLGSVSNVLLTGGSNGQALITDGNGNLSFGTVSGSSNSAAPMPYYIPNGNSYIVNENFQGLFNYPLEIDGTLEVDGILIELYNNPSNGGGGNVDLTNVTTNIVPTSNGVLSLGNTTNRWSNLWLSGNTIYLGNATISATDTTVEFNGNAVITDSSNITITGNVEAGNTISANFILGDGGFLTNVTATGNIAATQIQNGTSLVSFSGTNGNILFEVAGNANVFTVTADGVEAEGNVTASKFISNVPTGIAPLVVTSTTQVANLNAATAGSVRVNAQPNITSVGTLTSLAVTGNITAGNVTATLFAGNATTSGTVTTAAQPNITSVGNLTSLVVTGDANANSFTAVGAVTGYTLTGKLTDGSQPNITQVGNLGTLVITGNLDVGNINGPNSVGANYFTGNGYYLSQANASNLVGTLTSTVLGNSYVFIGTTSIPLNRTSGTQSLTGVTSIDGYASAVSSNYQPNITSIGTLGNLSVTSNIGTNLLLANHVYANLGNVVATLLTGTLTTAAQPNITSVGTLTDLSVSGNIVVSGNLAVQGDLTYVNVTSLDVEDPIIAMGGGPNSAPLTTNDGKDRGTLLHYYTSAPVDAFMGWDNSAGEFTFGSNVSVANEVVTFNTLGNIKSGNANLGNAVTANFYLGDGGLLSNISVSAGTSIVYGSSNVTVTNNSNVLIGVAGNANIVVISSTGANITGYANITGNADIGNISTGGLITATGNVSGGNITTGGVVTATGNVSGGNITTGGVVTATGNVIGANIKSNAFFINGVTTGITAAGTVQGNATALTTSVNIVTTTSSGTGVVLPTAVGGMILSVINAGGNVLAVYPAVNGVINSLSANVAYSLVSGGSLQFVAGNTTQWYTLGATYA